MMNGQRLRWSGLLAFVGTLVATTASADLVSFYSFDRQDARDAVSGNDGELNGNPDFVDGASGAEGDLSIRLNSEGTGANDDFVAFGDTEFGDQFSITAWIRPIGEEQSNQMMAIAANTHGGFAGPDGFKWTINQWNDLDESLRLETGDTQTGTNDGLPAAIVFDSDWQHVGISFDKDSLSYNMFVDGGLIRTGGILDFGDGHPWQIGAFLPAAPDGPTNAGFIGDIDSVAVFDHLLTEDEVLAIFENGIDVPDLGDPGDFNADGALTAEDIDLLSEAIRQGNDDPQFDVNADGVVDDSDRSFWIVDLKRTYVGDANLDLEFSSADFVDVFVAGEFEDGIPMNSTWATGDWDGNHEFESSDFVAAFIDGGFEIGPRAATASVPEPVSGTVGWLSAILFANAIQRWRRSNCSNLVGGDEDRLDSPQ